MKFIRRFFTYLFTIIAVLVLTYSYVYWDGLFSKDTPAGQLIGWMMGEDKQIAAEPEPVTAESIEMIDDQIIEPVIEQQAKIEEEITATDTLEEAVPVVSESPVEHVLSEMPASVDLPVELALPVVNVDKPDIPIADEEIPVVVEASQVVTQESSLSDLWKRARHSFHYRDFQTSVDSYQQIITRTQDNFDAYEELGDVYAYYGKNEQAANAYYEAASILVRLGKLERAAGFMKPLSLLDSAKARALLDSLEAAKTK